MVGFGDKRLPPKFWGRVRMTDTCWNWQGCVNRAGYGSFPARDGRRTTAHRAAYEALVAPLPASGFEVDHLCRNTRCVNPNHLEAVTVWENNLRGTSPMARNARKTHCVHGHPYDEANTIWRHKPGRGPSRNCRTCDHVRKKAAYDRDGRAA